MSTLSLPRVPSTPTLRIVPAIPAGYAEACCEMCQSALVIPAGKSGPVYCPQCVRSQANYDAFRLMRDVRSLVLGESPFDVLSCTERQAQLDELFSGIAPAPKAVDATLPPVIIKASVKMLTNRMLIDLAGTSTDRRTLAAATGELSRRLADPTIQPDSFYVSPVDATPDAFTRDDLESRDPAGFDVELPERWDGMA